MLILWTQMTAGLTAVKKKQSTDPCISYGGMEKVHISLPSVRLRLQDVIAAVKNILVESFGSLEC